MPELSSNDSVNHQSSFSNYAESEGMGWLLPLLLLVFAAALVLYFVKGSTNSSFPIAQQFITSVDTSEKISAQKIDSVNHPSMEIELPNNSFITGAKDGIERHLVEYMNNQKDSINKNRWFNFDNVFFENDDATLTSSSQHQIENIVSILKAYPKMKIKIGAFAEKSNNEAGDLSLTLKQANAVEAILRRNGANAVQIVSAEGYGSKYAKASANAPISEKMTDRKIAINVTEK